MRAESASISRTWSGNCDASNGRRARDVAGSVPGARPIPRSMRSGCSASSVWNASATRSGVWFGSMMPPDPTRMREVAEAMCSIRISGTVLAMLAMP